MSKAPTDKKEAHSGKPEAAHGSGEHKKEHSALESKGKKGAGPLPGGCHAVSCKSPEQRFDFCEEHYEQFKFGLIKKSGEQVPDYEKKFEHYQAYKAKRRAHKVA